MSAILIINRVQQHNDTLLGCSIMVHLMSILRCRFTPHADLNLDCAAVFAHPCPWPARRVFFLFFFWLSWHCRCPWAERGDHWELAGSGLPAPALAGHPGLLQLPDETAASLQLPGYTLLRRRPGLRGPAERGSQLHHGMRANRAESCLHRRVGWIIYFLAILSRTSFNSLECLNIQLY